MNQTLNLEAHPDGTPLDAGEVFKQLEKILGPEAWRLTPATFAVVASEGAWQAANHLQHISLIIATELAKGNARIIVSMPPRHGKSELLSIWTPTWLLDKDPTTEIILASYGAELATDFSRKVRDHILNAADPESAVQLNCTLRQDVKRQNGFLTTKGGGMRAMGIQGTITGRGADVFLIDDYLKNPKDASSPTIREDIWDSFRAVCRTRLEPNGSIIILATRWHLDDLIGRCIANDEFGRWLYIDLAAMALPNDKIGREVGAALWPERWTLASLEETKYDLGNYFWSSMYQQKPIPRSGGMISESDFPIVDVIPDRSRLKTVRYWDAAGTPDDGDYSVGLKMSQDLYTGMFYIEHVARKQLSAADIEELIADTAVDDGITTRIKFEQEPGSAGKNYVSYLCRKIVPGYVTSGEKPSGDKFLRAQPYFAAVKQGNVRLKRGKWNKAYIEECTLFPDVENDDQVDCSSGAHTELTTMVYHKTTFGRGNRENATADGPGTVRGGNRNSSIVTGVTFGRRR